MINKTYLISTLAISIYLVYLRWKLKNLTKTNELLTRQGEELKEEIKNVDVAKEIHRASRSLNERNIDERLRKQGNLRE